MTALLFNIVLAFERGKAFKDRLICSFLRNGRTYTGVISSPDPFSSFASFTAHAHAMQIETFLQHSACFGNKRLLYNSVLHRLNRRKWGNPKTYGAILFSDRFLLFFSHSIFLLAVLSQNPSVLVVFSYHLWRGRFCHLLLVISFSFSFVTKLHLDTPVFISLLISKIFTLPYKYVFFPITRCSGTVHDEVT